ncbi:nicotianamine synthase family protein [Natroniella sp. ANB-PHB2]|uniref:nicotianamine synthase family protein n=1 Tax=Natroniella sp. ANB-PHB2 TaxID=3384444 RepID=UPI0038D47A43
MKKEINTEASLISFFSEKLLCIVEFFLKIVKKLEHVGNRFSFFRKLYCNLFYKKMIERELELAELNQTGRILHIGSGPLPLTAIILAENGYDVTGIDNDPKAITVAQDLITELGLDSKIDFKLIEGMEVEVSDFDLILFSLHVIPKKEIVKEVLCQLQEGQRLIYRNPNGLLELLYPKLEPAEVTELPTGEVKQSFGKQSVVITKKSVKK